MPRVQQVLCVAAAKGAIPRPHEPFGRGRYRGTVMESATAGGIGFSAEAGTALIRGNHGQWRRVRDGVGFLLSLGLGEGLASGTGDAPAVGYLHTVGGSPGADSLQLGPI